MNLQWIASAALALALVMAPLHAEAVYLDFTDDMFASMDGQHEVTYGGLTISALPGESLISQSEYGLGIDCQGAWCRRDDDTHLIDAREILYLEFEQAVYIESLEFSDHSFFEWAIVGGETFAGIALGSFAGQTTVGIGFWTSYLWLSTTAWSDYALAGLTYSGGSIDLPGTRPIPEPTSGLLFAAGMLLVGGIVTRLKKR